MVNKLAIVTLILIGLRISAAEMPVLPFEILGEITTHADNLDVAAENILNFLQVNKKMSAEYTKNPQQYINTIIQELAKKFNVDPIVAAVYLYKNKYALEFFKTEGDKIQGDKKLDSFVRTTITGNLLLQALENFDHSIQAIVYMEKLFPGAHVSAPNVLWDIEINCYSGIKIETQPELLIINTLKIPLIGCKTIYVRYVIHRRTNLLLYGYCNTPTERHLLIIIVDTQGNVKNIFTHYLGKSIPLAPSNPRRCKEG